MKSFYITTFFLLVLAGVSAGVSFATPRTIQVEWGYTPPEEPAVTGYHLYQNGESRVIFPPGDSGGTQTGEVALDSLLVGDVFTLTALFADETESPHSMPYVWFGGWVIKFIQLKVGNRAGKLSHPGQVRLR